MYALSSPLSPKEVGVWFRNIKIVGLDPKRGETTTTTTKIYFFNFLHIYTLLPPSPKGGGHRHVDWTSGSQNKGDWVNKIFKKFVFTFAPPKKGGFETIGLCPGISKETKFVCNVWNLVSRVVDVWKCREGKDNMKKVSYRSQHIKVPKKIAAGWRNNSTYSYRDKFNMCCLGPGREGTWEKLWSQPAVQIFIRKSAAVRGNNSSYSKNKVLVTGQDLQAGCLSSLMKIEEERQNNNNKKLCFWTKKKFLPWAILPQLKERGGGKLNVRDIVTWWSSSPGWDQKNGWDGTRNFGQWDGMRWDKCFENGMKC